MSRQLGQIIAVRENTWMIGIPLGCDPETTARVPSWSRSEPGVLSVRQSKHLCPLVLPHCLHLLFKTSRVARESIILAERCLPE
jgi:hypothetical protein